MEFFRSWLTAISGERDRDRDIERIREMPIECRTKLPQHAVLKR